MSKAIELAEEIDNYGARLTQHTNNPNDGLMYACAEELRRLAAIEQERTALLVNEQNLREELEALLASLGEPYGWHYTNNGGASVFHKGPSNKLDADMQAAADYPKVHRVKTLYALTNKDQA
jgi:glutamate-1-semialdehyde aminotransferase